MQHRVCAGKIKKNVSKVSKKIQLISIHDNNFWANGFVQPTVEFRSVLLEIMKSCLAEIRGDKS